MEQLKHYGLEIKEEYMQIEGGNEGLLMKVINKQFEMIGEKMTFEDLPDDGIIEVNEKKMYWYNHYKFTEEQEKEWVRWAREELQVMGEENGRKLMDYAELRYGFLIRYKKKGELF